MNQSQLIGIVAALMVLTMMVGGLMRRRMRTGEGLRLAFLWLAIIVAATLIASVSQRIMR